MIENVVFMSDILHHCFLYTLFMYEERKNSKKNNKENTLKGKVTDFLQSNHLISMRKLPTFFSWWIYLHATSSLFVLPNPMSFVSKLYDFCVETL